MNLEIKQTLKLSQSLVMTPQLQLSLRLLAMNRQELAQTLQTELLENPTLEEDTYLENIEWTENIEVFSQKNVLRSDANDFPDIDQTLRKEESLKEHLLWQIQMSDMNIIEREIADCLLGELDDQGYLDIHSTDKPLQSIVETDQPAQMTYLIIQRLAQQLEVPTDWVENVRKRIMHYDPVGCLAGDVRECLLAQLEVLGFSQKTIPYQIVDRHLADLERHHHRVILQRLHIQEADLSTALRLIEHLEPNPARSFSSSYLSDTQFVSPDIFVTKNGDEFSVALNDNGLPKLKLNHFYLEQIKKHKKDASFLFIQEKIRAALWLTKAIYQRQNTILRVTQTIIQFQKKWFSEDLPLRPLTLQKVAEEIGMHESTVSRVTSGKFVLTPKGLFDLKYFFSAAITTTEGESISGEAVKEIVKKMIAAENVQHPYSDAQLVLELARQNIFIARRTIAKYRESLDIPPSHQRKRW